MMLNSYIRIGFLVNKEEYEDVCAYMISIYQNNNTTIIKKDNYCLINSPLILIRIFCFIDDETTIDFIIQSGRYILIVISNKLNIKTDYLNLLYELNNLGTIWKKDFSKERE